MLKQCLVIIISIFLIACGKDTIKHEAVPVGGIVLAFGNSVTYGYGVAKGKDYPTRLTAITGWKIVNAGISGERADQAKYRIDTELNKYAPHIVLIELGGNDFLQRREPSHVKEDLRVIIKSVKARQAIPVLIAVPTLSPAALLAGKPRDSVIYAELAAEEKVLLIHSVFSDILGNSALRADQVHPNAQGYQVLAEGIASQLIESGLFVQ